MTETSEEESLIEFPCDFTIKVVGTNLPEFYEKVCQIARKHDSKFNEDKLSSRQSSTGKYRSLTLNIYATDRPMLDAIYQDLTTCELVQWAL